MNRIPSAWRRGISTWTYPSWGFGFSIQKTFAQVYAFGRTIEIRWMDIE